MLLFNKLRTIEMSQQGDERDGSLYVFGPMRPTCGRHSRFAFCSFFVKQNVLKQTHQSAVCFDSLYHRRPR